MGKGASSLGEMTPNPFSPGFGQVPATLVGRDDLLADLGSGLATGPRDVRYTSIVMGVRGSGKTVVLTEIEDRAAREGWIVLSLDAGTEGVLGRIRHELRQAPKRYPALELDELDSARSTETTSAVKLGPFQGTKSETITHDPDVEMGVREQLAYLAETAQQNDTSVLLTIDELHSINRDEARRLSNDLQHITKRQGLPLAFIGAGLLEMRYTILQDKKMTFFHRCEHYELPPLDHADAISGLRHPIEDANGTITEDALQQAAHAVGSSPYKLQVLGHGAWKLADAPERIIDRTAVGQAIPIAQDIVERNISFPALYDLSQSEREYLATLVKLGRQATIADIARQSNKNYNTMHDIHRRLLLSGYLAYDNKLVSLTELVPAKVVRQELLRDEDDADHVLPDDPAFKTPTADMTDAQSVDSLSCREWMPRAQAYCVLKMGHHGGCRSKKPR